MGSSFRVLENEHLSWKATRSEIAALQGLIFLALSRVYFHGPVMWNFIWTEFNNKVDVLATTLSFPSVLEQIDHFLRVKVIADNCFWLKDWLSQMATGKGYDR